MILKAKFVDDPLSNTAFYESILPPNSDLMLENIDPNFFMPFWKTVVEFFKVLLNFVETISYLFLFTGKGINDTVDTRPNLTVHKIRLIYVQFGLCVFGEEISSWKGQETVWICLDISQFLKAKHSCVLVSLRIKVLFVGSVWRKTISIISPHTNISSQIHLLLKTSTNLNPIQPNIPFLHPLNIGIKCVKVLLIITNIWMKIGFLDET